MSETGEITGIIRNPDAFKKGEDIIEDYGMAYFMKEAEGDEYLDHDEALTLLGAEDETGSV